MIGDSTVARQPAQPLTTFAHAVLFVMGFSAVFIIGWGGMATVLGQLFYDIRPVLGQIGGLVVITFGMHTLGIFRLRWLDMDTRPNWTIWRGNTYLASGLMGVIFAAGWTPCIGTVLGAILTLAISQQTASQGMTLASGYALGLGLPFLAISLFMDRSVLVVRQLQRHMRKVQIASGVLLIMMGLLMLTKLMFYISIWAQRSGLYLDLRVGNGGTPTYVIAILGGLVSFLSPCVLPLVPAYVGYLGGRIQVRPYDK